MTPASSSPETTGKQNAEWRPAALAASARGKSGSTVTSTIHAGARLSQTLPGSPCPIGIVVDAASGSTCEEGMEGECQSATRRRLSGSSGSFSQAAATSQPSASAIAPSTAGYELVRSVVSASSVATACSARRSVTASVAGYVTALIQSRRRYPPDE